MAALVIARPSLSDQHDGHAESTAHWHEDLGVELAKLAADLVAYFELPTTATWSWAARGGRERSLRAGSRGSIG